MGIDWWEGHSVHKISLVSLYLELIEARVLHPLEGNNKEQKTVTHNNTLDNPIFMHIQ